MRIPLLLVLALLLSAADLAAQRSLKALRASTPITVDGRIDEPIWQSAEIATDFRQREPNEEEPATQRTEVRVLYDNDSLYVSARLFDNEASRIVRRLARRDEGADADGFVLYVDALHDHQTGAAFEVSAGGTQRDFIISNDTSQDDSWDAVWESAVVVDSEGWSVEMRIPLSQLRFLKSDEQTWGFNAHRRIQRNNESDWFELVPKRDNGLASRMAHLTGIDNVEPRPTLEIVPYVVARGEFIEPAVVGNPFNDGSRAFSAAGFDLKYALKPNIILNATMNPDFGQVEIDPAVVNLGAFETFYPEKRPFFIEGAQVFSDFGYLGANNRFGFNRSDPLTWHTRRIGRAPQGSASGDYVHITSATTILGAAKITGKTDNGWTFGLLDAVTGRESAEVSTAGQRARQDVEPRTNYFAGRVLKEFGDRRAGLGGLFTSVNRDLNSPDLQALLHRRGTVAGVDGYYFLDSDREWVVNGRFVGSDVAGSAASIERLQLEPQRYYHRPETPEVRFDPSRRSLRGWNSELNLNRNRNTWNVNAAVWAVSPGFESGDLGFHFNGDVWGTHVTAGWSQIRPDSFTRDRYIRLAKFYVWNYGGAKLGDGVMSFGGLTFLNYWSLNGNLGVFRTTIDDRLTRGGPPAVEPASTFVGLNLDSDFRKRFVLHLSGGRDSSERGGGGGDGSISVEWKPSPRLNLSTGPSYSHSVNIAQYVTQVDDPQAAATYGKRYVFARLQQKELSIDTRVNLLFSPKATLQVFMQPLAVVGDYLDFKSLARPRTFDFDPYDLDFDPDFNFKSLRLNAIFRWEWRLGSTLYIAWTQQRQDLSDPGVFRFGRDLAHIFTGPMDNVFMVKFSRWFSR